MKYASTKNPAAAQTGRFLAVCGFIVFALTAVWAVFFVPMNMDEAGIYHFLACTNYPFAGLHTFRAPCQDQQSLTLPFGLHIARAQFYVGLWHSIIYAPFYFLFHAVWGQYLFGLCLLLAFAFLMSRQSRQPMTVFWIAAGFFPFLFQFIHDTGPVNFAMLVFPLSGFFLEKILTTPSPLQYGYAIALAVLFLCGVEDKPFLLYLAPSIGFFALAWTARDRDAGALKAALKESRAALLVAAAVVAAGLLTLFLSTNDRGQYYIAWLIELTDKKLSLADWFAALFDFLFYWPSFAQFTFDIDGESAASIVFRIATFGFVIACALAGYRMRPFKNAPLRTACLGLSFASAVVIFLAAGNTWAGHHFVFLWVPLILLFADLATAAAPQTSLALVIGFFTLNLASTVTLTQETIQTRHSAERDAIFHFFADDARASNAIINYSSWGGYFIQSLYGPKNQLVTYTEPYDEQQLGSDVPVMPNDARGLLTLSQATGRRLYNVCFGQNCTKAALEAAFGGQIVFNEALPGLPNWRVFAASPR